MGKGHTIVPERTDRVNNYLFVLPGHFALFSNLPGIILGKLGQKALIDEKRGVSVSRVDRLGGPTKGGKKKRRVSKHPPVKPGGQEQSRPSGSNQQKKK